MPISLQFRLIQARTPQRVAAGFLPGSDVAAWLREMQVHAGAQFYVVPDSKDGWEAGGLLIVPFHAGGTKSGVACSFSPRVMPCALEHDRVIVPASTLLDPVVRPEEVNRLLPCTLYFFHPGLGLVGFDEADAIRPESLIVRPLLRPTSWLRARVGSPPTPKLSRISLTLTPDLGELFGESVRDIGSSSPNDLQKKAPLSEKLRDGLKSAADPFVKPLLQGLAKLLSWTRGKANDKNQHSKSQPPPLPGQVGSATPPGSLRQRMKDWTAGKLREIERRREKEIQRLIQLLEKNPDEGLRHAISLDQMGDIPRGDPIFSGTRLNSNDLSYGSRNGQTQGDAWNVSQEAQWKLREKYRHLANRELAEKRFDRAAYIFSSLLGDWNATANALKQGRYFQEAARIYTGRLNSRLMAAQCLEEGHLLQDALLLYAELAMHEKCGDLLRQLGDERGAVTAYQKALENSRDRLHDARILFDKLRQPGLALSVLASGYPHSEQARPCLETHFAYLTRLDATEDSLTLAAGLAAPDRQMPKPQEMSETLLAIRQAHPHAEVRERLSTVAIRIIGTALSEGAAKQESLLKLLPQFIPEDTLLDRDANRFAHRSRQQAKKDGKTTSSDAALSCRSTVLLSSQDILWQRLECRNETWLATGHHQRSDQSVWTLGVENRIIGKITSTPGARTRQRLVAHLLPYLSGAAWLPMGAGTHPVSRYALAQHMDFSSPPGAREPLLGKLSWMPDSLLAVCPTAAGTWILTQATEGHLELGFYLSEGQLQRSYTLEASPSDTAHPIHLVAHKGQVVIAIGSEILQVNEGKIVRRFDMDTPVLYLTVSHPLQPGSVLVVTYQNVLIMGLQSKDDDIQLYSTTGTSPPVACFLNDGQILAGEQSQALTYSAYPGTRYLCTMTPAKERTSALRAFAPWGDSGVAALRENGVIEFYS